MLTDCILIFASNASKVALAEKSDKFSIRDIGVMTELMDSHCGKSGGGVGAGVIKQTIEVEKTQLEKSQFELALNQLKYDRAAILVFKNKISNHFAAIALKKNAWKLDVHRDSMKAVEHLWNSSVSISAFTKKDRDTIDFTSMVSDVQKKLQLRPSDVVRLGGGNRGTHKQTHPANPGTHTMSEGVVEEYEG